MAQYRLRSFLCFIAICAVVTCLLAYFTRHFRETPVGHKTSVVFERSPRAGETSWELRQYRIDAFTFANGARVICIDGEGAKSPINWYCDQGNRVRVNGELLSPGSDSFELFVSRDGRPGKRVELHDSALLTRLKYTSDLSFAECEQIANSVAK